MNFNENEIKFPFGIDLCKTEAKNLVLHNIKPENLNKQFLYKKDLMNIPGLIIFDPEDRHIKIFFDNQWKSLAFLGESETEIKNLSLNNLNDIQILNIQNGDILKWDSTLSRWINSKANNSVTHDSISIDRIKEICNITD